MDHAGQIKEGPKKDVLPVNNPFEPVVPQIMACCAEDFLLMANYLKDLGYKEVNWNLGCPYPMVAKRDLGSGILNKPDKLFSILDEVLPKLEMDLGIKMRMGYEDTGDILEILPRLNDYPLEEIIVHARYGKQLYNGSCDHDRFRECVPLTNHRLIYNGDIRSVQDFRYLKQLFPEVRHWMIGRGAIADPFLFEMIQDNSNEYPDDRMDVFLEFLEHLLESHLNTTDNHGNVLLKMTHFWEYFMASFENGSRYYRMVKKADSVAEYRDALSRIYDMEQS